MENVKNIVTKPNIFLIKNVPSCFKYDLSIGGMEELNSNLSVIVVYRFVKDVLGHVLPHVTIKDVREWNCTRSAYNPIVLLYFLYICIQTAYFHFETPYVELFQFIIKNIPKEPVSDYTIRYKKKTVSILWRDDVISNIPMCSKLQFVYSDDIKHLKVVQMLVERIKHIDCNAILSTHITDQDIRKLEDISYDIKPFIVLNEVYEQFVFYPEYRKLVLSAIAVWAEQRLQKLDTMRKFNLSFISYVSSLISISAAERINRIKSMDVCLCKAKCTGVKNKFGRQLDTRSELVLCRICRKVVNIYNKKTFGNTKIINDEYLEDVVYSCCHKNSTYDKSNYLYKIDGKNVKYNAYIANNGSKCIKYITMCTCSRTCYSINIVSNATCLNNGTLCGYQPTSSKRECAFKYSKNNGFVFNSNFTCFEPTQQECVDIAKNIEGDENINEFVKTQMCTGCKLYYTRPCTNVKKDKIYVAITSSFEYD